MTVSPTARLDVELGGVNPALYRALPASSIARLMPSDRCLLSVAPAEFVPVAEFDSWFTIGADAGDTQSQLSVVGIDKFENASTLTTSNGALFASDPASVPDGAKKPTKLQADRCALSRGVSRGLPHGGASACGDFMAVSLRR